MSDHSRPPGNAPANAGRRDPLDDALVAMPREVEPSRDLWPGIAASLSKPAAASDPAVSHRPLRLWLQFAAGFVLIIGSSVITYFVTERTLQRDANQQAQRDTARRLLEAPVMPAMPANFVGTESLGADYQKTRASLDAEFQKRLVDLPPAARARLQNDLADLRRAAADIAATLNTHPSHPLLQELLLSTYQSELALMSSVNELTASSAPETRL